MLVTHVGSVMSAVRPVSHVSAPYLASRSALSIILKGALGSFRGSHLRASSSGLRSFFMLFTRVIRAFSTSA